MCGFIREITGKAASEAVHKLRGCHESEGGLCGDTFGCWSTGFGGSLNGGQHSATLLTPFRSPRQTPDAGQTRAPSFSRVGNLRSRGKYLTLASAFRESPWHVLFSIEVNPHAFMCPMCLFWCEGRACLA